MQLTSFNYSMPYSEDQRNLAIISYAHSHKRGILALAVRTKPFWVLMPCNRFDLSSRKFSTAQTKAFVKVVNFTRFQSPHDF
ncbi:hypothetical protein WAI453_006824 [Rhynchosporium graminicola]